MAAIGYRPEIDGLRAIAVVPVILFHMNAGWMPGGYIGVDVFFVISGFLITSIIKKELEQGIFSFRDFWARRVRRILPAMIFVTACTLAATYFLVFRPEQQAIGKQALAGLFSVANIYYLASAGDYWGTAAEESPFLHTWSLSVEEQFYLFFPIIIWLVYRFRPRWLQGVLLSVVMVSLLLFVWGVTTYPTATFYLLPTRVWELGTGCLLALTTRGEPSKNSRHGLLALAGLGMIIWSYLFFDHLDADLGLSVFGTALVISFAQTGLCNSLLTTRWIVHIGKISYSLYLWHWPVLVLAKKMELGQSGLSGKLLLGGTIYLLALGTYYLVEKTTRRREKIVRPVILVGIAVASCAFWMAATSRYYDTSGVNRGQFYNNYYNIHPAREMPPDHPYHISFDIPERKHVKDIYRQGGLVTLRKKATPDLVLIGDSLAIHWAKTVDMIAQEQGLGTAFYAMHSWSPFCSIPPQGDHAYRLGWQCHVDETMLRYLAQWRPKAVMIGQRWIRKGGPSGISIEKCLPLIEWLGERNIQVLLVEMPAENQVPLGRDAVQDALFRGIKPNPNGHVFTPAKDEEFNTVPRELATRYSHVTVIEIEDLYSRAEEVLLFDGLDPVYVDCGHLTQHGAMMALPRLAEAIRKVSH